MNAEQIKRIRDRLRLTQSEFAKRLNVTLRTVQRWESSESTPHAIFIKILKEMH